MFLAGLILIYHAVRWFFRRDREVREILFAG